MPAFRAPRWITLLFCLVFAPILRAQTTLDQIRANLIGQPLYLRGAGMGFKLEFDAAGRPIGDPQRGPITLSGVDVLSVEGNAKKLTIRTQRVALIANADGRLERRGSTSTTLMFGTVQKRYIAKEEVELILHADAPGAFDAGLRAIFANGLPELATSAPPFWSCYAKGYFAQKVDVSEAEKITTACIEEQGLPASSREGDVVPPEIVTKAEPAFNRFAAQLQVNGTSTVHVVIDRNGIPVRFQVVRAVGGGMDEATLQAISQYRFQPATRSGVPVESETEVSLSYRSAR